MDKLLKDTIENITPANREKMREAKEKIDNLTKPLGSLGEIEEIAIKFSGITGKLTNSIKNKNIIIMCADNGVVEEGVSACPKSLTETVTNNFSKGITGVCVLSKFYNSSLTVVDIGVDSDNLNKSVLDKKIAYGTKNISKESAMSRNQTVKAIEVGIEVVEDLVSKGADLLGTGEMGIGNTTTSTAVLAALTGLPVEKLCGKGSGLTNRQLVHKTNVIKKALYVNQPKSDDILDVLGSVGGFDIAGLCGCFLGAARNRVPIVIDGLISSVAALCAAKLSEDAVDYMFASHISAEPASKVVLEELGLNAVLDLKMRLGEGAGCPLAFNIIESSLYTVENMGTFEEASIVNDFLIDIRSD